MGVFGDTLRQARAHKGVTLREAEVATRIKRHWLLALEEEHFDQLPAPIYQRGIVRNYATYLDLDQAKLLQLFHDMRGEVHDDHPAVMATPTMVASSGSFVPNFAVIAFVLVAMGAAFVWGYSAYFAGGQSNGNAINAVPTATPLGDEERFIATSTAVPATVTATAPAPIEATQPAESGADGSRVTMSYPTEASTSETTMMGSVDEASPDGETDAGGMVAYSFYALTDVDLLVVADNNTVWNETLYAGQSTGYLSGSSFVVSLTGADSIMVIDGQNNETTYTDTQFTLP
jgi:cytoskeletal protein RodZ